MARPGKLLVTGCKGQLGLDFMRLLDGYNRVSGIDVNDLDIRKGQDVLKSLSVVEPEVVIHTAAYTDVDGCEIDRDLAIEVNAQGTRNVALACREVGARLVYFSTDYVFDGTKDRPYTEKDTPDPCSVYGQSKLAGEEAVREILENHLIIRIAWLYSQNGRNFVKSMLDLGSRQLKDARQGKKIEPIRVVDDQIGNPTWTADVVRQTKRILEENLSGTFHASSEGEVSWYQFARDIFELNSMSPALEPCTSADYVRPAPRPKRSSLANQRLRSEGLNLMPNYRTALERFFNLYRGKWIS